MIEVSVCKRSVKVEGHAGCGPPGKDIVCAGVSALAQSLVQSLEDLTEDKIEYSVSPGRVDIEWRNLSEQGMLLVDSFFVGVCMIANEYPERVRIL